MRPTLARLGIAIAVSAIFAGSAQALPGTILPQHPRLYATNQDIQKLIDTVPLEFRDTATFKFPGKRGRLSFEVTPSGVSVPVGTDRNIFGNADAATGIFLRHVAEKDGVGKLQLGVSSEQKLLLADVFDVQYGVPVKIEIEWDAEATVPSLLFRINGRTVSAKALSKFDISGQPFAFGGYPGDRLTNFQLAVGDQVLHQFGTDQTNVLESYGAWNGLLASALEQATGYINCNDPNKMSIGVAIVTCKLTDGGRFEIIERAKWLALAYRLTGKEIFVTGARSHLQLMYKLNAGVDFIKRNTTVSERSDAGTGGEWSMSARVGAMGIYYDWLFDALSPAEKAEIRTAILQTVTYNDDNDNGDGGNDDLRYVICGDQELSGMRCALGWDEPGGPSDIAREYLAGHATGAQFNTVLGLLAIRDEDTTVDPLIDTIYRHFEEGVIAARAAVTEAPCTEEKILAKACTDEQLRAKPWLKAGVSGGFQTLFGYNATSVGEYPERLRVWERALQLGPTYVRTTAPWLKFALSPYIYGLRGDANFPARSDNFTINLGNFDIGPMALAAAQETDDIGALAQDFYRNQVIQRRWPVNSRTLWEQLMFGVPENRASESPAAAKLPLSALYPVSGNVLIRDNWDYANAALLDFKSTSFISINHHHLDQNSFSLFYKAPLLIDSGQYDSYGSVHWLNYYQRTIAHNSIVVWDKDEQFAFKPTEIWANDGGQWYDGRHPSPTIKEITGTHKLDGITAFEEGEWYAYTEGDATKAYPGTKLSADAGFVRSVVYLRPEGRPNDTAAKATVVVFDKVRTGAKALAATSLLHMVDQPGANSTPAGSAGRYLYPVASDKTVFTVRNGEGMATIQALLPKNGKAMLVGGQDYGTNTCKQVVRDPNGVEVVKAPSGDCRYLTYKTVANVADWYNYAPATLDNVTADNGKWRLELSPATTPAAGAAQYFLNVIRVADTDQGTGEAALAPEQKAVLVDTGFETVGVQIGSDRRIIFNGAKGKSMWPIWQPGTFKGTTLVVGVLPNQCYGLTDEQGMKALKPGVGCDYKSSAGGVITIR